MTICLTILKRMLIKSAKNAVTAEVDMAKCEWLPRKLISLLKFNLLKII